MKGSWCKKKTYKKRMTRKTAQAESDRKTQVGQIPNRRRDCKEELRIPLLYSAIWPLNRQDERKGGLTRLVVDWSVILPAYPYTLSGICSQHGMLVLEDAQKQERAVC